MKEFKPTYLYVKTHNKTGLKYFGKTTKNPFTYLGSGKYWVRHLKVHGTDITTEIIGFFSDPAECRLKAIDFSKKNKITESVEWANIQDETGLDGGDTARFRKYTPMTAESKAKMIKSKIGKAPWNKGKKTGKGGNTHPRSAQTIEKLRSSMMGMKQTEETKRKRSASVKSSWEKRKCGEDNASTYRHGSGYSVVARP